MDNQSSTMIRFTPEPTSRWLVEDFQRLLVWGSNLGMSDLVASSNDSVWIRLSGQWKKVTNGVFDSEALYFLLTKLSNNDAAPGDIKSGKAYDFPLEIKINRSKKQRFRVCATACVDGWGTGLSLVFRSIPEKPPTLEELKIEQDLIDHVFPENGLVLVTGTMGSGKSTLLAAILREIAETRAKHIISYEEPIEFDLMNLDDAKGPVIQSAVPLHVRNFKEGIINSTRRAPDVLLVGESRNFETFKGILEAAEIGVAAYTTAHTRSVSETMTRLINIFPHDQQNQIASTLISCLRLIIQQRLLPSEKAGGRFAIREYLNITPTLRKELTGTKVSDLPRTVEMMVQEHGVSLLKQAQAALDAGYITNEQMTILIKERKEDGLA